MRRKVYAKTFEICKKSRFLRLDAAKAGLIPGDAIHLVDNKKYPVYPHNCTDQCMPAGLLEYPALHIHQNKRCIAL
jgi:hypothetical protein